MATRDGPLRVLVVADDPLAGGGLAALVAREGFEVLGPATSRDGTRAAEEADVIVWDAADDPARFADRVGADGAPIVAIVSDEAGAAGAMAAGAAGALFRHVGASQIAAALRGVHAGNLVLDRELATLLRPPVTATTAPLEALTARELEVLPLLALGLSNKEIGARLQVSEHTAKFHVNAILGKLGAQSRTEAVVRAARAGLLIL